MSTASAPSQALRSPQKRESVAVAPLELLRSLWRNRHLVWQFTVRNVEVRHKGSHLGLIWSFLNPLLMVGLYVLVFGFVFPGKFRANGESKIEYAFVMFLGLATYHFVAEVIGISPTLIIGNPNFVKKVVFPLEILPVSAVGGAVFHLIITLVLVFVGAFLCGVPMHLGSVWLPVILFPIVLTCVGIALLLSALGVFWRDISQLTQFLLLVLMFASAVFYPITQIPPRVWAILRFNPIIHALHESRSAVFWDLPLNPHGILYLYVFGTVMLVLGAVVFNRLRPTFADVL